ncbi:hypothetical protein YC2023_098063 [Brassica napus]
MHHIQDLVCTRCNQVKAAHLTEQCRSITNVSLSMPQDLVMYWFWIRKESWSDLP